MKKILLIGEGGREHGLGEKVKADAPNVELFFALGNAGTAKIGTNVALNSLEELTHFAKTNAIDLTIVGSEKYLAEGIVDVFEENNLKIFGPNRKSAQLEANKAFSKQFLTTYQIPTASFHVAKDLPTALQFLEKESFPLVIKASGLAQGKGVFIVKNKAEAEEIIIRLFVEKIFGEAGTTVVIETFLVGYEASLLCFANGKDIFPLLAVKDHKKIGNHDTGLNTGGMGTVAPHPILGEKDYQNIQEKILNPTNEGLLKEGLHYCGILFIGLMITEKGAYVLEFNVRFGDPETQVLLPLLKSNLLSILEDCLASKPIQLEWNPQSAVCVVLASGGYPNEYQKGFPISLPQNLPMTQHLRIAGAVEKQNKLLTSGGRVLNAIGLEETLEKAYKEAYDLVSKIHFEGMYCRTDIGKTEK